MQPRLHVATRLLGRQAGAGPRLAIECKWSASDFDPRALKAFAARYPNAESFVVAQDVERAYAKNFGTLRVTLTGLENFVRRLGPAPGGYSA